MLEIFTYKRILALAVLAAAAWIGMILYRVGREDVIKKIDFLKSKWKIVLFWFVIAALAVFGFYVVNKLGLLNSFYPGTK